MIFLYYTLLFFTVLLLWLPLSKKIPIWAITFSVTIITGLISNQLDIIALLPVILLALCVHYNYTSKVFSIKYTVFTAGVLLLSTGLMLHKFPGFYNLKVIDHVYISKDAIPFTAYFDFDKAAVGILILGLSHHLISNRTEWIRLFKSFIPKMLLAITITIILALALGYVRFDPKLSSYLFIWSIKNLLLVCVAEEALFRGFIQKNLSTMMQKIKYGNCMAIIIASLLFGIAHAAGGVRYVLLATVAGIGYGWIYNSTRKIESSILTHFGLNLIHMLFFTYPALASAM